MPLCEMRGYAAFGGVPECNQQAISQFVGIAETDLGDEAGKIEAWQFCVSHHQYVQRRCRRWITIELPLTQAQTNHGVEPLDN